MPLLRLLLIDDSEDDFAFIWDAFHREGVRLEGRRVETPGQLAAALEEQTWDLALLDWVMPLLTSPEAVRLMRASRQPGLPCIVWSGRDDTKVAFVAETVLGAMAFVPKSQMGRIVELARPLVQAAR